MSSDQNGFTYVAMLFALAIFSVGLAAIGESWGAASHREKETELIEIGQAYARAIGEYYAQSPGSVKAFPRKLDELVEDKRFVGTQRHLRKIYSDPMTNGEWATIPAQDGGIAGVFSRSDRDTLRKKPIVLADGSLVSGTHYSNWKFVYHPKP